MPSLRDVIAKAHGMAPTISAGPDTVYPDYYAPRHLAWLLDQQPWSAAALEHARKYLAGEYAHERTLRFSPSAMGSECQREMLFSWIGAPKLPNTPQNEDKAESGTFEHLRWQMEGLTAGWLAEAEVWMHAEELRAGGSLDGIGDDGSLFELKNTAPHLFEPISTGKGRAREFAAKMVRKHKLQMECYWLIDSLQPTPRLSGFGSLVYQDTGSKDVYEIRIRQSDERRAEVHQILEALHGWVDVDLLPDMLEGCWAAVTTGESPTGPEKGVYDRCAYRKHCPTATTVSLQ